MKAKKLNRPYSLERANVRHHNQRAFKNLLKEPGAIAELHLVAREHQIARRRRDQGLLPARDITDIPLWVMNGG